MAAIERDRDSALYSAWRQAESIAERLKALRQRNAEDPGQIDLPGSEGPTFDDVITDVARRLDEISASLQGMAFLRAAEPGSPKPR